MKLQKITQRALETYEEYLLTKQENIKASSTYRRLVIMAAVKAGFADDVPDDLENCEPWQITEMTRGIVAHVMKSKEIPGE